MRRIIEPAMFQAAQKVKQLMGTGPRTSKGQIGDIVTNADYASEEILLNILTKHFPGCKILSEETRNEITTSEMHNNDLVFVIDPLDGTTNISQYIRHAAISVGAWSYGSPFFGAVYDIFRDTIYTVESSHGLSCSDEKLQTTYKVCPLPHAIVGTEWAYGFTPEENLKVWTRLVGKVASVRIMGSAVLDLVMTALGQFTCYVHNSIKPYDCGAALLMLKEMGLKITNWDGTAFDLFDEKIIVAPPEMYPDFFSMLTSDVAFIERVANGR